MDVGNLFPSPLFIGKSWNKWPWEHASLNKPYQKSFHFEVLLIYLVISYQIMIHN